MKIKTKTLTPSLKDIAFGKKTYQEIVTTQSDKCHQRGKKRGLRLDVASWEGPPGGGISKMSSNKWCELASKGRGRKREGGDFIKWDEYMEESRRERPWGFH